MNNVLYSTPLISKPDAKGNSRYWIGYVTRKDCRYYTSTEYWSIKSNGEESTHIYSELVESTAKNVGKSNESKPYDQAVFDITSLFNKKIDSGYREQGKEEKVFLPMLAQKFSKKAEFPAFIQRKYDGARITYHPNGKFYSRKGKEALLEVTQHIKLPLGLNMILDGELMLPLPYTFQETMSAIKKQNENTSKLVFYIYDCYVPEQPELTFNERHNLLFNALTIEHSNYFLVETILVDSKGFYRLAADFINEGYEGAMYRHPDGIYKPNIRSADLLKFKEFEDDEFEIVDVVCGKGKEQDCAIFVCKVGENKTVPVSPNATIAERKLMYTNKQDYIGKMYTVRYFGYTDEGSLRIPRGICVRDYE